MQLSSQEEYGLRCLLQVARHDAKQQEPLRIPEIASAEGLSPEYTAKLMRLLRQGGLVRSTRGATGGYHLSRPAEQISVWEALTVLGGALFSEGFCEQHPGQLRDCVHSTDCSVRSLWTWIGSALKTALSAVSLKDLYRGERATTQFL